ncbi:hypothetical protein [Myxococcus sp. SDU36]|uniref:hypothetical protein n=1 Tax=Myxococcus sp. SDU36 TaxID=2831967 RepID=UPI0025432846|nr:hypothetical protein [Myxococcus sp. SDU36]WIG94871.1 hypothetical protein KGD87_30890 [Myxococcus sp. SDU36]
MSKVSRLVPSAPRFPARAENDTARRPAVDAARQQASALRNPYQALDGLDLSKAMARAPVSLDGAASAGSVAAKAGRDASDKKTIRVETGVTQGPFGVSLRHHIEISVTPLDLGIPPEQLDAELARATAEKHADDMKAYGADMQAAGFDSFKAWSEAKGYYGSPSHQAWAEAASARTGGQIPASWWMEFDPFGGTAGNGPHILPGGEYPSPISKIAMAHDTDWSLGRHFGVGPLSQLQDAPDVEDLGPLGLDPRLGGELYILGHADWDVDYGSAVDLPGP